MNTIKGTQEVQVKVSTMDCYKVVKNNPKDLTVDSVIRLLWVKYKQLKSIPDDWFVKSNQGKLYWYFTDGYDHYECDLLQRELTDVETKIYHHILDLTELMNL